MATETYNGWSDYNAPRLGAALAYYSLLSIAPLTILVVAICGLVFRHSAEQEVLQQTEQYVGPGGAATLQMLLTNAHHPKTGILATIIAIATLLFGASGVFTELQSAMNAIWQANTTKVGGIKAIVKQRLGSFLMVLCLGLLLLVSLLATTAMAIMQQFASGYVRFPAFTTEAINLVSSFALLVVFFGLIYKFVPDVPIQWRDVWVGAAVTALLFVIGKSLLALYFETAAVGSTYGAAGSVVALVVWVYYSAQIFFFGAVFTRIFAQRFGSRKENRTPLKAKGQSA